MMKFEEILSQWEKQKKVKTSSAGKQDEIREETMDDWLEMYPPDRKLGEKKEIPDRIIIHTRKKELARMDPQETLDLHGWTGQDAVRELDNFLRKSKRRGLRKVMVIHGKGLHSPGGESVLRPIVKKYLEQSPLVRDYGRAKGSSGGGGATWIMIR